MILIMIRILRNNVITLTAKLTAKQWVGLTPLVLKMGAVAQ